MIETFVRDYLAERLPAPVGMEVPERPPATFAVLEKTGSGQGGRLGRATLSVQSYAPTLQQAAELNELVKREMAGLGELPEICRVELNSDYNFTDTASKRYRYQAIFDLIYY